MKNQESDFRILFNTAIDNIDAYYLMAMSGDTEKANDMGKKIIVLLDDLKYCTSTLTINTYNDLADYVKLRIKLNSRMAKIQKIKKLAKSMIDNL